MKDNVGDGGGDMGEGGGDVGEGGGDMGDSHGEVFAEDFRLLLMGLSGVKNADSKPGGGQD